MSTFADTRAVSKVAGYDRVLVDGQDVTYFRGAETIIGDLLLTEPFAYGPTTLGFPRIAADLEAASFGTGDLSFIREGASVIIQTVDNPTAVTPVVLSTDYRGFVLTPNVDGRDLTLEVGGEFSARAAMVDKQTPLVRRVKDVGFWAANNVIAALGFGTPSRFGPTTGIEIVEGGGSSMADWAGEVCAWSQTDAGVQRAIMPTVWGGTTWDFQPKDTTTVDLTLFTDDARVVPHLRDDLVEKTNVWYGTGVSPDGERWRNARYPGLIQGPAPTFPGAMTVGDVDADTTTGDGVTVLTHKLVGMGLLSIAQGFDYGSYTSKVAAAVKVVQRAANLTVNGTTNLNTWNAVFDVSATGYSLSDAHMAPLYADPRTQRFLYTANGSVAGLNPAYDPTVIPVHRTIDFGPGVTKAQATAWCVGQAARLAGDHWTGTIELAGGFGGFVGEWAAGSHPTGADIMPQTSIRPGMNARLPMFGGGILVHIAGVSINRRDRSVTLTVDTLARDLLELAAIIGRNTEAKRSIRREWRQANRPRKHSGNMVARDELFGRLTQSVDCDGDGWTVFPVVAGQAGQVNRIWLDTTGSAAAYAVAVFSKKITRKRLNRRIGNPLAAVADGAEAWYEKDSNADLLREKNLLYAAGTHEQPCGYWPRKHTNDAGNTTAADITGEWVDDSSFPYICDPANAAVVWVAIYPDRDCRVRRGQILYAQEDDAS